MKLEVLMRSFKRKNMGQSTASFQISNYSKSALADISNRESEVLNLLSFGLTTQVISKRLFLSHHTINSHRKNLLIKLNANNTPELIRRAFETGYLTIKN